MEHKSETLSRRKVLGTLAAAGVGLQLALGAREGTAAQTVKSGAGSARRRGIKLGFDNFSIRALGWKAPRLLEHAAALRLDTALFSDLHVYESLEEGRLGELKAKAAELGIEIQAGTGGICPTSRRVNKDFGSPEEHLRLAIRTAKAVGSAVVRCYLGSREDRRDPGGIERHIASTVELLKSLRGYALEHGVNIAVENHAGDMTARELASLIEVAGKDFVGATVDSGNAVWALEDPVRNLEVLAPYALSSGIRDAMVWENEEGAVVQWTALGEGLVDLPAYFDIWERVCPRVPVQLEIISGFAVPFPYFRRDFWGPYDKVPARDFAAFAALARKGKPIPPFSPPAEADRKKAEEEYQLAELERSVRHAREALGLGLRS